MNPTIGALSDPDFVAGVGPNGGFLLTQVDFEIVGQGTADLEVALGPEGVVSISPVFLDPPFGSATFTTASKLGFCKGDGNRAEAVILIIFTSIAYTL